MLGKLLLSKAGSRLDGKYQLAGFLNGYLYRSSDYGATWSPILALGIRSWSRVCGISSDGQTQIAGAGGTFFISNDFGETWSVIPVLNLSYGRDIVMSGDGRYFVRVSGQGDVFYSNDYGQTAINPSLYGSAFNAAFISPNGQHMRVLSVSQSSGTVFSSNYGASWSSGYFWGSTTDMAYSEDGKYQNRSEGGWLYSSSDYGNTLISRYLSPPSFGCARLAMSLDGQIQYATTNNSTYDRLYYSTDYGNTYSHFRLAQSAFFLKCSGDGSKILAGMNSRIAVSHTYGFSWNLIQMSGTLQGLAMNCSDE